MSEFDFDELDKAVAGVINTEVDTETNSSESSQEVVELPKPTQLETTPAPEPVVEAPAAALATRRSSGRFMDVVHPSSDMRTRSGTAIVSPTSGASSQNTFTPPVAKPEETFSKELSNSNDSDGMAELDAVVGEWTKPLESPFLTDAKVEKRPLGGVGPEPSQALLDAPEEELLLEAPDEPLLEASLPDPIDFAAQQAAAELSNEKEDTGVSQSVEHVTDAEPAIKNISEIEAASVESVKDTSDEEPVKAEEPSGPTSITQQYTEQASSTQQSGSIFDTENYHKPFVPAAKKHSGAWTIIWILLLVVLGAGAGVAFYLFVLPLL